MKQILNPDCSVIYFWYDHLVLRKNGDAEKVTKAINDGDYDTFMKFYHKYPSFKTYYEDLGECEVYYFPDTASIFYNDEIIGRIDITTQEGFNFITDSEFECG